MEAFLLLFFLGGVFAAAAASGGSDDSNSETDPDTETEGDEFIYNGQPTLTGTDGDDTITLGADIATGERGVIDGAGGDDRIDLSPPEGGYILPRDVFGGEGNDTIEAVRLARANVLGGAGDDHIQFLDAYMATVAGGEGDDFIEGSGQSTIDGGPGNDTLIGSGNVFLGGDGNDLLVTEQFVDLFVGVSSFADAGAGDDTIRVEQSAFTEIGVAPYVYGFHDGGNLFGGSGADTWELVVDEGVPTDHPWFDSSPDEDGVYFLPAVVIADFESGTDVLVIDGTPQSDAYTLTTARVEIEDQPNLGPTTTIVLRYESDTEATRDVTIALPGATLTSWDDVTFVGDHIPTLEPIGQALVYTGQLTLTGTEGNDTITQALNPLGDPQPNAVIDGGGGDDLIDLLSQSTSSEPGFAHLDFGSTLRGGDGDDTIEAFVYGLTAEGGAGDDVLAILSDSSSALYGGDGNDVLTGGTLHVGMTTLDGGPGDDTITGVSSSNALGGEGNDLIYVSGRDFYDAGYFQLSDGGAGNDTIAYSTTENDLMDDQGPTLNGGADADLFDLTLDQGTTIYDNPGPDGTYRIDSVTLGDFDPSEDRIEIDATPRGDAYDLTTARFEQTDGSTQIVLRYESVTEAPRDMVIDIGDVPPSWDYVTFTGDQIPTLEPIGQALVYYGQPTLTGTEGNDTITQVERSSGDPVFTGLIDGGGGNDLIVFGDGVADSYSGQPAHGLSTILGGEGNDTLTGSGGSIRVEGGPGDDVLDVGFGPDSTVFGGEGDDVLSGGASNTNGIILEGGPGNDTLSVGNGVARGGSGDDLLIVSGWHDLGAAYLSIPLGEEGNDTLQYTGDAIGSPQYNGPLVLSGGEDADLFDLTVSQSNDIDTSDAVPDADGVYRFGVVNLGDFDPAEDRIEIDATPSNDGYDLTTARFEDSGASISIILRYEHATEPTQDVVIRIGDVPPSWNYVTFTGDQVPTLLAVTG